MTDYQRDVSRNPKIFTSDNNYTKVNKRLYNRCMKYLPKNVIQTLIVTDNDDNLWLYRPTLNSKYNLTTMFDTENAKHDTNNYKKVMFAIFFIGIVGFLTWRDVLVYPISIALLLLATVVWYYYTVANNVKYEMACLLIEELSRRSDIDGNYEE